MSIQNWFYLMLALVGVATAVSAFSLGYRMIKPPSAADLAAINLFLRNRRETLVKVEKMWFGGPPSYSLQPAVTTQTGRPYKLLARSSDGALWTHKVATNCLENGRIVPIMQCINGAWQSVHY